MKRTLIVEVTAQVLFDEEMNEVYSALSPEEQEEKLREMREEGEKFFRGNMNEGAKVVANVYVKEDAWLEAFFDGK